MSRINKGGKKLKTRKTDDHDDDDDDDEDGKCQGMINLYV